MGTKRVVRRCRRNERGGALLGTILIVFAVYAALEAGAERRAQRMVRDYVREGDTEMETLMEMAKARKGRFPGSVKVVEMLERLGASGRQEA